MTGTPLARGSCGRARGRRPPPGGARWVGVRDLGLTEDVDAVRRKAFRVAREHQPGTGRLGGGDEPVEPEITRQGLELERVTLALEEVADPRARHVRSRSR